MENKRRITGTDLHRDCSYRTAPLFPILGDRTPLTGLARIAAEGKHAEDGHLVEFRTLDVRSILNRSVSRRRLPLDLSINPYRGCEFGCKYCYARYTHTFLAPRVSPTFHESPMIGAETDTSGRMTLAGPGRTAPNYHDPNTFEQLIFMKQNVAWLLEQELKRADPALEIALGTATDPYQPIERHAKITRSILEVFARQEGRRLGIVTKSCLIERDVDLLRTIANRNKLVVHITVTTLDAALARKLEPRAPRPDLRLCAVKQLRENGITTGVLCAPVLPGITDSEAAIDGVARRAAAAGANFFAANALFLKPCSRATYLEFVREHFPALVGDYEQRFGAAEFAAPPYRRQLARAVARACRRYGLGVRSYDGLLTPNGLARGMRRVAPPEIQTVPGKKDPGRVAPASTQAFLFG